MSVKEPYRNKVYFMTGTEAAESPRRETLRRRRLIVNNRARNYYQQTTRFKKLKNGISGDDGGHIGGSQFDGPGEQINQVPMKSSINRPPGTYYQMETDWKNVIDNQGTVTDVKWEIIYEADNRPIEINVTAKVNGKTKYYSHTN